MDFVGTPFGGVGVELPLVASSEMRPDYRTWEKHLHNSSLARLFTSAGLCHSQESIAIFIQEWLYFGLLAILSHTTVKGYDFSVPGERGSRLVSSELVRSKIINMQLSVLQQQEGRRANLLRMHQNVLYQANAAAQWVENYLTSRSISNDGIDIMMLSVKILIGTISRSCEWTRTVHERTVGVHIPNWNDVAHRQGDLLKPAVRAIEAKMTENGWCMHQINKVLSTFSFPTAYYFAKLPRPGDAGSVHENCSKRSCRGWNSKPGQTNVRHATDACSCSVVSVSSTEVARTIQSGHIPLVSIREDAHGALTLRLHTKNRYSKYVAISHVWADGLGNAFENGLPTCQLRVLQTYFSQIAVGESASPTLTTVATGTLFWMDTLCIPVQIAPPGDPIPEDVLLDVKGRAIDKMNIVYSSSSHTLVLDAEMRMVSMAADYATKLAYTQCCGWTTRSWTLQEGCLSPSTVYAFSGGILHHDAAQPTVRKFVLSTPGLDYDVVAEQFDSVVHREIWASSLFRDFSVWNDFKPDLPRRKNFLVRDRFAAVWNELLDRVSSLPADTPAIFANLLGVSAYEVLKRKTEQERIALIIRQQKVLPIELLFNTGPRLRKPLNVHSPDTLAGSDIQHGIRIQEHTPEESIGLIEMTEFRRKSFNNAWVPASMSLGDKCLQPLVARYYLQILDNHLRVHHNGIEGAPYMYTTWGSHNPMFSFVLQSQCYQQHRLLAIDIVDDSTDNAEHQPEERVLGHCFMYDPGLMDAMLKGHIHHAPGCHLLIVRKSGSRVVTRYSSPIRLSRCTPERQIAGGFQMLEGECNCRRHGGLGRHGIEILYDADDLGPLLPVALEPPKDFMRTYGSNRYAVFATHISLASAFAPYPDTRGSLLVITALVIMPLVVHFYQKLVLPQAANRLFLEPLNDRGRSSRPFMAWTRDVRHFMDATLIAHWSVILFGPALDGLFWIILKVSEGRSLAIASKSNLLVQLGLVALWYFIIGTRGLNRYQGKLVLWIYICLMTVCFVEVMYDFYISWAFGGRLPIFTSLFLGWKMFPYVRRLYLG